MSNPRPATLSLLLLILPVILVWGLNFAVIRVGVGDLQPITLAALRFAVAAVPMLWIARPQVPWWFVAAYALLFGFGQFGLLFTAMALGLPSGLASLVLQLQVVFTALLSWLVLREAVPRITQVALLLCLLGLGAILLEQGGASATIGWGPLLLCVGAAACWGGSNVVVRVGAQRGYVYSPLALVVWASALLPVPLLALAGVQGEWAQLSWSAVSAAAWPILYLGVMATLVGYYLWVRAMRRFSAATVAPSRSWCRWWG